ncbi:hypothetical protein Ahy_B08g093510 [Arachis hypogaea]|uniref:Uncharacterized protein n=1 Tax=Arachis hypogaea TaxID=3818 RepID=A0A444Y6B0_ARAHY|nr:hypothetical protein Ahy_B08g093510 [Arachis hypogaea]
MSEEKKTIVRDLGFGGLMHIPPLRVHHQVLRELANNFKLGENRLETGYGSFKIRPKIIGDTLGINASGDLFPHKVNYKKLSEDDKEIFRRFQSKTLKNLTDEMMDIGVETETTDSDSSTSESETQEDSEDSPRKEPCKKGKKIDSKKRKKSQEDSDSESESTDDEDLDEFLRENNEKSAAEGEKEADLRSTEGHYVSSKTIPDVNLESDDPSSQGHIEQSSVNRPAESMLSLVEESASEPADSNMMVVRKETPSEGLAIVPIQVCLPVSQTTTVPEFEETPETEYEPTPLLQIEGTTKTNPAPEDAAALMMMACTASYVPKKNPMPSFSLGFTDSSQEETTTQEGASTQDEHMAKTPETPKLLEQLEDLVHKIASGGVTKEEKSPQIPKESGAESFEKFETHVRPNLNTTDMKQKCYHWAIRVKTYVDGLTDEFDNICRLQAQDIYTLSKFHLASLAPKMHIEAENMVLANHPEGVFLQPKNNKPFRVEDYPMFIPFLDLQKLKSHRYDEVDHFSVEYASRILFHDMNLDKDEAIRGSNAIRLSKPSSLLLSPYCQIDSQDVDTA